MPNTPIPQGDEFQVNTTTEYNQHDPSITALADGGFVVTWMSSGQDVFDTEIFAQRYDSDGNAVDNEFQVNTTTTNYQGIPSITALADGGFVVTWQSEDQDGSGRGIYAQRYGADGIAVDDEFQVNTFVIDDQINPTITALANGGFVITWRSENQDGDDFGIFGQRYGADGTTLGDEFQVNTYTTNGQYVPSVTALADGGFVVTWMSVGQDGDSSGIFGQRYSADGATAGDEFQVNTYTKDGQSMPVNTALADGGFLVTWRSDNQDGSSFGIYAQRYSADGATVGDEFQVNTHTTSFQGTPSPTALADGGFVVTWMSTQDGSSFGIYAQRYDADGAAVGREFQVNTYTTYYQGVPSITALADGGFVVTWESFGQDGSFYGIFAQQFAAQLFGTAADDEITDDVGANWIDGQGGDDILGGGEGDDIIYGNQGDDTLHGDDGDDELYGGADGDTLHGGNGDDLLKGGKGDDNLSGGNGDDVLKSGRGGDVLYGDTGNDTLKGGKGKDVLNGGFGDDALYGGKGADVFAFAAGDGFDTVFRFKDGSDKLDLSAFDFDNKAEAKSHFFERGSANNDVVGFKFDGTTIRIEGLDLGDINGADIII